MNTINHIDPGLAGEMMRAATLCGKSSEEEGGIIIARENECEFVKVKNVHTGTMTAGGLYEASRDELSLKVISRVKDGWKFFASFHTHPTFSPSPSQLDFNKLFQSFKHNIIYSPYQGMFSWLSWIDGGPKFALYYVPQSTVRSLAN